MRKIKKQLIIFAVILILFVVGLSGCNDNILEKIEYKIGESVIFENIKYTFLSAYWDDGNYTLKIKGENVGNEVNSSNIEVIKYEMQNGNTYKPLKVVGITTITFDLNPGKNDTQILIDYSSIDRDFLPVTKIYLEIYSPGGNLTFSNNFRAIEINVI